MITPHNEKEVMQVAKELDARRIGERLRAARGMEKRKDVCKAIGVSLSALGMWEQGKRIPGSSTMIKLADHYRTTVQALFFD